jgi:hypothetical protein
MTETAAPTGPTGPTGATAADLVDGLASQLTAGGSLTRDWRAAFRAVHRHLFVPDLVWRHRAEHHGLEPIHRAERPEAWWESVYQDNFPGHAGQRRCRAGRRGTGWNTALLAHRLGALSTACVYQVPYAWITQTRPGGLVLTSWATEYYNGHLLALQVQPDATAIGRIVGRSAFMAVRDQRVPRLRTSDVVTEESEQHAHERRGTRHPRWYVSSYDARAAIGIRVPRCKYRYTAPGTRDPDGILWLLDQWSGSWAAIHHQPGQDCPYRVRHYGPALRSRRGSHRGDADGSCASRTPAGVRCPVVFPLEGMRADGDPIPPPTAVGVQAVAA